MATNTGSNVGNFLLGLGIGVSVAILFAPKDGGETRMYLKNKMKEGRRYAQGKVDEMQKQADDLLDRGEQAVVGRVERISSAVDAGLEAYRQSMANGSAANARWPPNV